MTQKYVQVVAYAVLLILGVNLAWAEVSKEANRELLPTPQCCCEKSCASDSACCAAASAPCCAKQAGAMSPKCEKAREIRQWLQTACPLDVKNMPLRQALDELRAKTGLTILVDEAALSEAGIGLDRPLTIKADGVSFGNLLSFLLRQAHLAYTIKDGALLVTTEAQARGQALYQIHRVGDLLPPADPIILPTREGDVFFGWSSHTPAGMRLLDETPEESLMDLITQSISPATWCDNGGPGIIDYFPAAKSLVVYQTPDVQEQIADLLGGLRRCQEEETTAQGPARSQGMPDRLFATSPPIPSPPPSPPFAMAAPLPPIHPHPVPFAPSPLPPPLAVAGLMPPAGPAPAPSKQETATSRAYLLEAAVMQSPADGRAVNCQRNVLSFSTDDGFQTKLVTLETADKASHQKSLLLVKATPLHDERVHVEIMDIHGKAERTDDGSVTLDLDIPFQRTREVKLGKTVKMVLERDEDGTFRKWVELTVKENATTPMDAVCPPPAGPATPAPAAGMFGMPCPAGIVACQTPPTIMPPAALQCLAVQPHKELSQTCQVQAVAADEKEKGKLIIRESDGCITFKSMELNIPGSEPLKLTAVGKQVQVINGSLRARADVVCRTAQPGCFVFEGGVKLSYKRDGEHAHIAAERVRVNLADGHLEIEDGPMTVRSAAPGTPTK